MSAVVWLGLTAVFLVIEIITVGLTSIWFAGGSLAALLVNALGLGLAWQVIVFLVISVLLLLFTRPFAVKHINANHVKTNYEGIIGKLIRITDTVDNLNQTGRAVVNGQEWTVRTKTDGLVLKPETIAKVVDISGVKLIVEPYQEETF